MIFKLSFMVLKIYIIASFLQFLYPAPPAPVNFTCQLEPESCKVRLSWSSPRNMKFIYPITLFAVYASVGKWHEKIFATMLIDVILFDEFVVPERFRWEKNSKSQKIALSFAPFPLKYWLKRQVVFLEYFVTFKAFEEETLFFSKIR